MDPSTFVDPHLTPADHIVLQCLLRDISATPSATPRRSDSPSNDSGYESQEAARASSISLIKASSNNASDDTRLDEPCSTQDDAHSIERLTALNDPQSAHFEPTVFTGWDIGDVRLPPLLDHLLNRIYIPFAKTVVRRPTDVVMLTHLSIYFCTSLPSAMYLYYSFTYTHGVLHWLMQTWYAGAYTLLMHQHIHMRGVLAPKYSWLDWGFPFILDPLMGHTWNTYYFHHVKHHHVEGNGPDDMSTTIRYQRDDVWNFLHYVVHFMFLGPFDLLLYFYRRGKTAMLAKAGVSEACGIAFICCMALHVNLRATVFVFLLPLIIMRFALMTGNWGQHAFVDPDDPESDFRSSITLVDVPSNRYCFNDGYHTSHHLNPLRHWREHPVAFLQQKQRYVQEQGLVFRNIDYIMLTLRLLRKDYAYLAKCLVPIGSQVDLSLEERAEFLRRRTRRFTEEDIARLFGKSR